MPIYAKASRFPETREAGGQAGHQQMSAVFFGADTVCKAPIDAVSPGSTTAAAKGQSADKRGMQEPRKDGTASVLVILCRAGKAASTARPCERLASDSLAVVAGP